MVVDTRNEVSSIWQIIRYEEKNVEYQLEVGLLYSITSNNRKTGVNVVSLVNRF